MEEILRTRIGRLLSEVFLDKKRKKEDYRNSMKRRENQSIEDFSFDEFMQYIYDEAEFDSLFDMIDDGEHDYKEIFDLETSDERKQWFSKHPDVVERIRKIWFDHQKQVFLNMLEKNSVNGKVRILRMMSVSESWIERFIAGKITHLGIYWTMKIGSDYNDHSSFVSGSRNKEYIIVIEGEVDVESIDIKHSAKEWTNLSYGWEENEARIFVNEPIRVIDFSVEKYDPKISYNTTQISHDGIEIPESSKQQVRNNHYKA